MQTQIENTDTNTNAIANTTGPMDPTSPNPSDQLTEKNNSEITEPGEPALQLQQHPTEPEVSRTELGSVQGEPTEPKHSTDLEQQFAEALKKMPEGYHEIAADLYESIHRRSKFAKLTSTQRHAIFELSKTWSVESVLAIIAAPRPVGMGFRTSLAGIKRFLQDYRRILPNERDLDNYHKAEEEQLEAEQAFEAANASDESFRKAAERQIRKRFFVTANNPNTDCREIRWLLKSLDLLRKPQP